MDVICQTFRVNFISLKLLGTLAHSLQTEIEQAMNKKHFLKRCDKE